MFAEHIRVAENLADTPEKTGDKIIWRKEDGLKMAKFTAELITQAQILGDIPSNDYANLLNILLSEQSVRAKFGQHPRIKILGPIEARLQKFDVTIIGEANEGKWPQTPKADMWMSRPMKKQFEMPLPERALGICAADFSHLLSGDKVYITRAEKDGTNPTNKSRWLLRLETVLAANFADLEQKEKEKACAFIYDKKYVNSAKNSERANYEAIAACKIEAPAPKPPLYARPRQLSAGKFADWLSDPYIIYARYILKLYPLEKLDRQLNNLDYGNVVHEVLAEFNGKYPSSYPQKQQALSELNQITDRLLEQHQIPPDVIAFWKPNLTKAFEWIVTQELKHRGNIKFIYNEIDGQMRYKSKGGDFIIKARADRVEETNDGDLNILDYKTGNIPTKKAVKNGFSPQLPIEALIGLNDGFTNLKEKKINSLAYWQIPEKTVGFADKEASEAIENTQKRIFDLIEDFDDENTPYYSHPHPSHTSANKDYDHLSRFSEWSVKDTEHTQTEENSE